MMLASMNMTQSGRVKQMLPIERPARVLEGFVLRVDRQRQAQRQSKVSQIDSQRRQPMMQSDAVVPAQLEGYINEGNDWL